LLEENAKTEELIVQEEDKKYLQWSILMEKKFSIQKDCMAGEKVQQGAEY